MCVQEVAEAAGGHLSGLSQSQYLASLILDLPVPNSQRIWTVLSLHSRPPQSHPNAKLHRQVHTDERTPKVAVRIDERDQAGQAAPTDGKHRRKVVRRESILDPTLKLPKRGVHRLAAGKIRWRESTPEATGLDRVRIGPATKRKCLRMRKSSINGPVSRLSSLRRWTNTLRLCFHYRHPWILI